MTSLSMRIVVCGIVLLTGSMVVAEPASGPLRVHPDNPRYFTDGSGRAILLTGSHTWNNLVDMGPTDPPAQFDYDAYLDWMTDRHHNFFRLWAWELLSWNTRGNREQKPLVHFVAPQPWQRTGPGKALDGKPKFDLRKLDDEYFTRLCERVEAAGNHGIYVAVMVFEGWGIQFSPGAWQHHPFNPNNNVNGVNGDLDGDGMGLEIHTGRSPEINRLQRAYVRRVIDTVNEFDNVLYEISNENHPASTEWQYGMIRYIKEYEAKKPRQHPVGMTFQYKGGSNKTLFDSPADWISPNPAGGYRDNPPAADGLKVIVTDTDHLWGIGGNAAWVWKSFLRGLNPIFMDPYDGSVLRKNYDPKRADPIRTSMGHVFDWSRRVNLAAMAPRGKFASSKYCLANPGIEYLAYFPANSKAVNMSLPAGRYTSEWFDTTTGNSTEAEIFQHDGGRRDFRPPYKTDILLHLRGATSQTSVDTAAEPSSANDRYMAAVRAFADTTIAHGRDKYGPQQTPLFVDGLQAESLEPARWQKGGETWVLSNFASQQPLLRLLDGLTALSGEKRYREAVEEATRYALKHLQAPSGLLYWGGHLAWDLEAEKPVGQGADTHELKGHQPYFKLMWRVDPQATKKLMEAVWAGHILDWSLLDYNRHANAKRMVQPQWDHEFEENIEVPFPARGGNLSFANVTPPLLHSGTMLALLAKVHKPQVTARTSDPLTWTRRLAYRWQQGKDPNTGLCGGQLSYRAQDRAQQTLGHVHPSINEAKIVASYHQTCRYHQIPLAQMQAGEALIAAGGDCAEVGREFVRWASEDLKLYARHSYDPKSGTFRALMTNGTPIRWRESKTGYYVPDSFAPVKPDGVLMWGYATAYRLTGDAEHWRMVRVIAKSLDLGDIGEPAAERSLRMNTDNKSWPVIYALLELFHAAKDDVFLHLASRVGDNLLEKQSKSGLFPRSGRLYARTGDEVPLALLHLAAALDGKQSVLPSPTLDSRFFHCEYDGPLAPHQQKRADKRTYDHLVFYGAR